MSKNDLKTVEGVSSSAIKKTKEGILTIFFKGLWSNNPGLCQLLGLCPLLAVTSSAVNALGLAIATLLVVIFSSVVISILRKCIFREVRIPLYVVLIATLVTVVRFYVEAYFPDLYKSLGIYLALIVTNCVIMGRAEAFAGRNDPIRAFFDAAGSGLGFGLVLFALGSIREIIGNGTWFFGASTLLGSFGESLECHVLSDDYHLLIGILPPGGFFVLALLIALKNAWTQHKHRKLENSLKIESIRY